MRFALISSPVRQSALFAGTTLTLAAITPPAALAQKLAANSPADRAYDAAMADYRAGRQTAAGQGGAKDEVRARAIYTKACERNDAQGCHNPR